MYDNNNMVIEVKTQFEGLHCWPDAPDEVAFLRNEHRHMFHVTVRIPVNHSDRDLEFIMVKRELEKFIKVWFRCDYGLPADLGPMSCESIGKIILGWACSSYGGDRQLSNDQWPLFCVGVFEDGENGCWVSWKE